MNVHLYRVVECDNSPMYVLVSEDNWHPIADHEDIDADYAFKALLPATVDPDFTAAFWPEDKSVEMLLMDVPFQEAIAHLRMRMLLNL
ncbi:hypothetical protein [Vibrio phage PJN101]|nr:hypothetical protein [Vibrio phage PJN101]